MFEDRAEAARRLAEALEEVRGRDPLVLAIPRGAAPLGEILARELEGDLDVVLIRKLGAPSNPELAVGAVSEAGDVYLSEAAAALGVGDDYLEDERERQLETIRARRERLSGVQPPQDPEGRVTIVVDDGVATGATMIAALRAVRARRPRELIAAVGVAPPDAVRKLEQEADRVVALETPADFMAVGQFYERFEQVSDDDVARTLERAGQRARR